jgi:DEAD/DEAH box helicase domain-containing protein
MCDRHDIGISIDTGEQLDPSSRRLEIGPDKSPRLFIYDNYPGGIGFSGPLFRLHRELLAETRRLIASCECESGCPGCVGPVGDTGPLAKVAALRILDLLLTDASAESRHLSEVRSA